MGCCWKPAGQVSAPRCHFPNSLERFQIQSKLEETNFGFTAKLRGSLLPWLNEFVLLHLDVFVETENRLHVQVSFTFFTKQAEKFRTILLSSHVSVVVIERVDLCSFAKL